MAVAENQCQQNNASDEDTTNLKSLRRVASPVQSNIYAFIHTAQINEYSNHPLAQLLGYKHYEIIAMGDSIKEKCGYKEDLRGLVQYFQSITHIGRDNHVVHNVATTPKNGTVVWLRRSDARFYRVADGSLAQHIWITLDIPAEKEAQDICSR